MNNDVILNDVEPSCDLVRRWGHDENLYFIDQDEDLILHEPQYVPVLIELAADVKCPKSGYALSILSYYSQSLVLFRDIKVAGEIDRLIETSPHRGSPRIADWVSFFRSIYERLVRPRRLSSADMELLAESLLCGETGSGNFTRTGEKVGDFHEFLYYSDSYRGYVYINPETGLWRQSKHIRMSRVEP